MRAPFPENIRLRGEPGLRDALNAEARRQRKTMAEFVRCELREALARRGAVLPDPATVASDAGSRAAA